MVDNFLATKPQKWIPEAYQKRAVKFLMEHAGAALFLDPGMGKTSITLAAFKMLLKTGHARRALVVAPLRPCYMVWPKEIDKWADFGHLRVSILHGPKKEDAADEDADVYVINPEGLEWFYNAETKPFKRVGADTLVIDESSRFKNTTSKRFKIIKPMLPKFARRWILTGTPVPNGLLDLFGQIYIVDLGNALGRYITHYRSQFFSPTGYMGYEWKLNPDAGKKIEQRVKPLSMRLDADDYLKLPKIVTNDIIVELPSAARKIYEPLEKEFVAWLESGERITAATAAAASGKLCQAANGAIYKNVEAGEKRKTGEEGWSILHETKVDALESLVEELGGSPLLVAYGYQHDLSQILKRFGKDTPYIGKGVSMEKCKAIEMAWNAGEIPLLLGHPQSMGHGLNLQDGGCHHVCWYDVTWDLELYDQFNRRVRRRGNEADHVFIHRLVAKDTVDDKLRCPSLASKDKTQKGFLSALKNYARNVRK